MKNLKTKLTWNCRNGGGLFAGLRIDFPFNECPSDMLFEYKTMYIHVGFIFFTFILQLKWDFKELLPW